MTKAHTRRRPPVWRWAIEADLSGVSELSRYNASRVLQVLAYHVCDDTGVSHPGINTIASYCKISARTVLRVIPMLEKAGLIAAKHIRNHGNMYLLLFGDMDEDTLNQVIDVFKKAKNADLAKDSLSDTMLSLRNKSLSDTSGVLSDTSRVLSDTSGVLSDTMLSHEHKNNKNNKRTPPFSKGQSKAEKPTTNTEAGWEKPPASPEDAKNHIRKMMETIGNRRH